MNKSQRRGGKFLAGLGIAILVAELAPAIGLVRLVFHLEGHYDINPWVALSGAVLGFVGFYILNPPGAMEGGEFLVSSFERITHGREGDPPNTTVARSTTVIAPKTDEPDQGN